MFEGIGHELRKQDRNATLVAIVLGVPMPEDSDFHLHQFEVDELHRIKEGDITRSFAHVSQPLDPGIQQFQQYRFAHGQLQLIDTQHLFVESLNASDDIVAAMAKPQDVAGAEPVALATSYAR